MSHDDLKPTSRWILAVDLVATAFVAAAACMTEGWLKNFCVIWLAVLAMFNQYIRRSYRNMWIERTNNHSALIRKITQQ